jgi:4-diphosphocytidyl-2-C-methyl-D-erythritol kinase
MTKITEKSFAKINLTLEVIDKLPSGFHRLDTVMTKFESLFDIVEISFTDKHNEIIIESSDPTIPNDENNICHKAASTFFEKHKQRIGVEIKLTKNIPHGAGLGGGSSNAASTLIALNKYFNNPFSRHELAKMSHPIGKDIAFFFSKKNTAFMTNLGEQLKKEVSSQKLHILIVNPGVHVSTKDAYENIPENIWFMKNRNRSSKSNRMIKAIEKKDRNAIIINLFNDIEIKTEKKHSIIKEIKQSLNALGALGSLMTGTGSTVFGLFSSKEELEKTKRIMRKHYPDFTII